MLASSMSREEIGSYLGLRLEKVSKIMSEFHQTELLEVNKRNLCMINPSGLQSLLSGCAIKEQRRQYARLSMRAYSNMLTEAM
ncbi:hypothetical protein THIX_60661 [Thiomonas sp. X19]|nr:hypothetical protein THIX_60661 [Thiomonas sp. X19]